MITAGATDLSTDSAAWFPGGHQVFAVYVPQNAGHSKANSLPDFDVRDVTAAHPDLDGPLGDSEILGNLTFCHETVFKRDYLTCRWVSGVLMAVLTRRHLSAVAPAEFNSAEHTLHRTATDQSSRTSG
jgi:hypothetical protein